MAIDERRGFPFLPHESSQNSPFSSETQSQPFNPFGLENCVPEGLYLSDLAQPKILTPRFRVDLIRYRVKGAGGQTVKFDDAGYYIFELLSRGEVGEFYRKSEVLKAVWGTPIPKDKDDELRTDLTRFTNTLAAFTGRNDHLMEGIDPETEEPDFALENIEVERVRYPKPAERMIVIEFNNGYFDINGKRKLITQTEARVLYTLMGHEFSPLTRHELAIEANPDAPLRIGQVNETVMSLNATLESVTGRKRVISNRDETYQFSNFDFTSDLSPREVRREIMGQSEIIEPQQPQSFF